MSLSIVTNYTGNGDPSLLIPKIGTSFNNLPQLKQVVDWLSVWQFRTALDELDKLIEQRKQLSERINALLLKGELLSHFDLNEAAAEAYREVLRLKNDCLVAKVLLLVQLTSLNERGEEKDRLLLSIKEQSPHLYEKYQFVIQLIEENKNRFSFPEYEGAYDVICVCGFSLNDDGTMPPGLVRRLDKAEELAIQNPSATLLLSGGAVKNQYNEAVEMKQNLLKRGIEEERLVALKRAKDTVGNVIEFMEYLENEKVDSICVVTSKAHLPRAWMSLTLGLKNSHHAAFLSGASPNETVTDEMMAGEHKLNYQTLFRLAGLFEKKDILEKISV